MRAVGDVVPAVVGAQAGASEPPLPGGGRMVPATLRGVEVVVPANPPPLPVLAPPLARHVAIEGEPAAAAPVVSEVALDGERVVVERPPRFAPTPVPAAWKRDVEEPIERLRRILAARPDPRTISAWLKRIAAGVARAPEDPERRREAVAAIVAAVHVCPHLCFTAASAEEALRRWKWWPAAAEVFAFCEEVARPYRAMLAGLEAVQRAPVATGPGRERPAGRDLPAERSAAEVEAVRAKAAAFMAEVRSREVAARPAGALSVVARPLTPAELLALCEAQAERASSPEGRERLLSRARMLRAQFPEVVS